MLRLIAYWLLIHLIGKASLVTATEGSVSTNVIQSNVSSTTTYSTRYLNSTGTNGLLTDQTVYMVAVPSATATTTLFSDLTTIAKANTTTTFATAVTSFLGNDGVETLSTLFFVAVPGETTYSSTKYTTSIGNSSFSTYNTEFQTTTGPNGFETIDTIYYIEIGRAHV